MRAWDARVDIEWGGLMKVGPAASDRRLPGPKTNRDVVTAGVERRGRVRGATGGCDADETLYADCHFCNATVSECGWQDVFANV